MRVVCVLTALLVAVSAGFAADGAPRITFREVPVDTGPNSLGASLTISANGLPWLTWVEATSNPPAHAGHHPPRDTSPATPNAIKIAGFDARADAWLPAHTVIVDASVAPSSADFPQLAIDGGGTMYVVWSDGKGGAHLSTSRDHGMMWSRPQPWTTGGNEVEKFSLTRLAGGRILAAWLDGRARLKGGKVQQLYARVIGGANAADMLVDASVCDCCQTTLAPFIDGGALVGYRARREGEVRDIYLARLQGAEWQTPRVLNNDDWRIAACPINGPRLATDGSRVAAAWFTAAGNEPRVQASFSPDAGARWLMPLRIDRGHPVGHVEVVLLRDGAFVVIWVENDGSIWLRRVSPEYAATDPIELVGAGLASTRGVPRAVLWRDYAGAHTSASALIAYTRANGGVRTLQVDIPEGDLFEAERNCNCAPTLEQLQGFPIRGTITALDDKEHSAQARHGEVPGVFAAGMHVFAIAPADFAALHPGRDFLGRVEWRNGAWRLFDIRLLAAPAK